MVKHYKGQMFTMNYRLIVLNSLGEGARAEDWACASDGEAIERAATYVSSFDRELWQGDRRVGVFAGPLTHTASTSA
jgi:hypothetical protein